MAYTQEQLDIGFEEICSRIELGESLRSILHGDDKPMSSTVFFNLLREDEDKNKRYARAKEYQIEVKFESIELDYSEEPQRDAETGKIDPAWVNLQRLKIDAKKWELSKLAPKKYGDKVDVTSDGEKLQTTVINLGVGVKPEE